MIGGHAESRGGPFLVLERKFCKLVFATSLRGSSLLFEGTFCVSVSLVSVVSKSHDFKDDLSKKQTRASSSSSQRRNVPTKSRRRRRL